VDEERVVEQAIGGCAEAFDELVRRHRGQIYSLIRMLAGGDADAEDLTQEAFVRAYLAIARFQQKSSFRTWLTRIAINVVHTHLAARQRGHQPVSLEVATDGEQWEAFVVKSDMETTLSRRQAISRALAMLPEEYRIAVTLKDVQGFEYHEIAEVLDIPIGTVESRVFRARRRLRPLLRPWLQRSSSTPGSGSGTAVAPERAEEDEDAEGLASSC
jgi:RNA polymerase sigma-70 factor (ECF subfamily)